MSSNLVNIKFLIPQIKIDLKYSTKENFTAQIIYNFDQCLLHKDAVLQLSKVQNELETMGLGLKVWDGFRPIKAQWKLWDLIQDERYVSDPRKGGLHTRGTAVDCTLCTADGQDLCMPSQFDDFSEKAHRNYMHASKEAIANRELLETVMGKYGFIGTETEWWHFDLLGWEAYPPIEDYPL